MDYYEEWESSTEAKDIKRSLAKYGESTACPYCGWSLKEPGHSLKECEEVAAMMREGTD